ncbi:MAG: tetratricopeptide repeat protein [Muribaculaceae bacterium]|nr:tetratricopeptide repeat protein [Muribaculaceae bacterium]MDE6196464.1 tetratricopeptide repeat protein [Muribaculaceae bacterium]
MDKELILKLFDTNGLDRAEALLTPEAAQGDAWALYMLGRISWKRGDKAGAITLFTQAVAIDPASEAAVALEQARTIMDFFNKDLYNP